MKPVSIGFILSMRLVLALHTEAVVLGGGHVIRDPDPSLHAHQEHRLPTTHAHPQYFSTVTVNYSWSTQ